MDRFSLLHDRLIKAVIRIQLLAYGSATGAGPVHPRVDHVIARWWGWFDRAMP